MARIRTVKPEFFHHEGLAGCSPHARLLAIALLQLADKEGRMRWLVMQVHGHAFPHEPGLDVASMAGELEEIGYLVRYEVEGKMYAEVPGFRAHQVITGNESRNRLQAPPRPETSIIPSGKPLASHQAPDGRALAGTEQGIGVREKGTLVEEERAHEAEDTRPILDGMSSAGAVRDAIAADCGVLSMNGTPKQLDRIAVWVEANGGRAGAVYREKLAHVRDRAYRTGHDRLNHFMRLWNDDGTPKPSPGSASTNPPVAGEPIRRTPAEEKLWQAYLVGEAARARGDEII